MPDMNAPAVLRYECKVCWHVYDPVDGDAHWQVPAGTPFDALPAHWSCPNCSTPKDGFLVKSAASKVTPGAAPESTSALLPDPSSRLEAAFRATAQRMHGLAFVNPALRVEAVEFATWEGRWLGVLVTPWSMNLMLLPQDPARWQRLPRGEKRVYAFPAGDYEFIGADDPAAGEFQMCSLFSPVLQFTDHDTARMTAQVARRALLDARTADYVDSAPATQAAAGR